MKKFCVMTTGRAGSTSLMDALAAHDDIAVPNKQVDSPDQEINKILRPDLYFADYSRLAGFAVTDQLSLVRAFYASNDGAAYAGFKTMPNRHREMQGMIDEHQMQFICLFRRDVPSTVASFIMARDQGSWRRSGEPQVHRFRFDDAMKKRVDQNLVYLHRSMDLFVRLPGAIMLAYEDLCDAAFEDGRLDDYFARPVRLIDPKAPTAASSYVENWPAFVRYVKQRLNALQQHHAQQ